MSIPYQGPWIRVWAVLFIVAVAAFAVVTVIVAVRGGAELRRIFQRKRF